MNKNFEQFIKYYPLLKEKQQDRITILISGKKFIVQNQQVREIKDFEKKRKFQFS